MTVVFTTIFGGSDSLKPAPSGAGRCVCFVDDPAIYQHTMGWELVTHPVSHPRREAWHLRCISHLLFPKADQTVWIDASLTLTNLGKLLRDAGSHAVSAQKHQRRETPYEEGRELVACGQASMADIDRQLRAYQDLRFPRDTALHISSCLVRSTSPDVVAFNETWDAQIKQHPGDNTQVSLDFSAWVHGLEIHTLRGTRHRNPYWTHDTLDHRNRRKPYRPEHTHVR